MVVSLRRAISRGLEDTPRLLVGISDAIRDVHIEKHVVDAITFLVKEAGLVLAGGWGLVEGFRTILYSTKEEEAGTRDEYDVAKAAGINVSGAKWLTEGEVEEVRQLVCYHSPGTTIGFTDVRSTMFGGPHRRRRYGLSSSPLTYSNSRRMPCRILYLQCATFQIPGLIKRSRK